MGKLAPKLKRQVKDYWENEPCDSRYGKSEDRSSYFEEIERKRYRLEPFIPDFANFNQWTDRRVLEIGVGVGVDFLQWIRNGIRPTGIDLTSQAVEMTQQHLDMRAVSRDLYALRQADVENLPFRSCAFDLIYSWGVLHHTPQTNIAFKEAFRVLAHGGTLKVMVYHVPSWTGLLLWLRYGALRADPFHSARKFIFDHLESPGTKAYTTSQMHQLLVTVGFTNVSLNILLGPSDLLSIELGDKYGSRLYRLLQMVYPRWLIKVMGDQFGLLLLVEATKP